MTQSDWLGTSNELIVTYILFVILHTLQNYYFVTLLKKSWKFELNVGRLNKKTYTFYETIQNRLTKYFSSLECLIADQDLRIEE